MSQPIRQFELFVGAKPPEPRREKPRELALRRISEILGELRDARRMPWSEHDERKYRILLPQMSRAWLPQDEAEAACAEFQAHLARLEHAAFK
jgi:hypothetical protein